MHFVGPTQEQIQRATQIVEPTRTATNFAANLTKVVLCALLLCCSGCFHRKSAIQNGFRLLENGGAPMLVPTDSQSSDQSDFQTSTLVLSGSSTGAKGQVGQQCLINGDIFSLRPASSLDSRYWIVRSPTISGWNKLARKIDIDAQWKNFTRGIARMTEGGCFPIGLTALETRAAIAQRIPLPAAQVALFFYSYQGMAFTDLAPGMEVRLQRFLPTAESISSPPTGPPRMWVASYEVIPRQDKGVRLQLTRKVQRGPEGDSGSEEKELLSLSQRFAQTPVLRLFLEGVYGTGQVSHGILIGASNQRQLDALTDLIHQSDPARCMKYQETVCTEIPLGSLSLYSTVWVNGRRTSCLFGASLAVLLRSLPGPEQAMALESAQVFRRVNPKHYAEIDFPHNKGGAAQLLLLPEDKVEWKH